MARFQINPGTDGSGSIEFEMASEGGGEAVKTTLSAKEAQELVDLVGMVRMMTPGSIAAEPAEGVVQAVVDPEWRAPAYKAPQGRVLVLRHPGFGWIHFIFPEDKADRVSKLLAMELGDAPTPPTVN